MNYKQKAEQWLQELKESGRPCAQCGYIWFEEKKPIPSSFECVQGYSGYYHNDEQPPNEFVLRRIASYT